ncbi:hypothetical protein BaRGS_00008689 [Batillaria attramentaria]|uniref:Uncharacterized protein n=1 Tax=Batillaria attramentaria TaxID=370345 RepID=A0ABD0LMC0_9CAEN
MVPPISANSSNFILSYQPLAWVQRCVKYSSASRAPRPVCRGEDQSVQPADAGRSSGTCTPRVCTLMSSMPLHKQVPTGGEPETMVFFGLPAICLGKGGKNKLYGVFPPREYSTLFEP